MVRWELVVELCWESWAQAQHLKSHWQSQLFSYSFKRICFFFFSLFFLLVSNYPGLTAVPFINRKGPPHSPNWIESIDVKTFNQNLYVWNCGQSKYYSRNQRYPNDHQLFSPFRAWKKGELNAHKANEFLSSSRSIFVDRSITLMLPCCLPQTNNTIPFTQTRTKTGRSILCQPHIGFLKIFYPFFLFQIRYLHSSKFREEKHPGLW